MAKNKKNRKSTGADKASVKAPAKTPVKAAGAVARTAPRSDEKSSSAPRGTVITKPVGRVRTFLHEVRIELKKVTWPSRKELIKSTGVVIVAVVIAAVFIGAFDVLWNWLVEVTRLVPTQASGG